MPQHSPQRPRHGQPLKKRARRMMALLAATITFLAGAAVLTGGTASAQQPLPRIGLPEQPLNEVFEVSNGSVGVPVSTACGDNEQIRFTFVADSDISSVYVRDNEVSFTVWEQSPLGLEPIAQYCDSGPNDTPISVGYFQGGLFETTPGERYWVSTWFDDGREPVVINPEADNAFLLPPQAPRLIENVPSDVDVRRDVGWGTNDTPPGCPPFPVHRTFVATSNTTRITVEDNEVDINVWSPLGGIQECGFGGGDWTSLTNAQTETLLPDVPDAAALGLNQTTTIRTAPGRLYYLGWISEDPVEAVVITDGAPPIGDLPTLSYGIADVVREIEPWANGDAARPCLADLPLRRTFVAETDLTRLTVTDNEVVIQVWNADDGDPAHCSLNRSWSALPGTAEDLLGPIDVSNTPYEIERFNRTMLFETIPGETYIVSWTGDDPAEGVVLTDATELLPEVSVTTNCVGGTGNVIVALTNAGSRAAEFEINLNGPAWIVDLEPGERTVETYSDQPNGYLPVNVDRNGSPKAHFDLTVGCEDPEPQLVELTHGVAAIIDRTTPGIPGDAARNCIDGLPMQARFTAQADVTRLTLTDNEVTVQVWHADDGDPAHCGTSSWLGTISDLDRDALLGPIDLTEIDGAIFDSGRFRQTLTFDTIPGDEYVIAWSSEDVYEAIVITESTDPAEASVTVTCLANNGRIDVNMFNPGARAAVYDVSVGNLDRQVTIEPRERGRVSITGRPDAYLPVTVKRNGSAKATFDPVVQCDEPVPFVSSPEVRVVNACQNGLGFVFFQFANPTDVTRSYIIQFEGVANRSTTARPYGAAVRGVSGRPPGSYEVQILASASLLPVYEATVRVVC